MRVQKNKTKKNKKTPNKKQERTGKMRGKVKKDTAKLLNDRVKTMVLKKLSLPYSKKRKTIFNYGELREETVCQVQMFNSNKMHRKFYFSKSGLLSFSD